MIPVGDINPRERTPYVTHTLVAINVAAFLVEIAGPTEQIIRQFGLVPAEPRAVAMITHMFLHGSILHLAANMLFLWIFGDNVEDRLGHVRYAAFYLLGGVLAAWAHMRSVPGSTVPMVGASGAISAVVGAYVFFYPQAQIRVFLWLFFPILHIPAWIFAAFWFGEQIFFGLTLPAHVSPVAWWAHIGGFAAGAAAALLMRALELPGTPVRRQPARGFHRRPTRIPAYEEHEIPRYVSSAGPADRWAVLLQDDPGAASRRIAGVVAGETDTDPRDHLLRIEWTRGVAVREVPAAVARNIVERLRSIRIAAAAVPDGDEHAPSPPTPATSVRWNDLRIICATELGDVSTCWNGPYLYVAGRIRGVPVVDIFLPQRRRVRATPRARYMEEDPETGGLVPRSLRQWAQAILAYREDAVVNPGVRVLAAAGRWGHLDFPDAATYEDYAFWYDQLVRNGPDIFR